MAASPPAMAMEARLATIRRAADHRVGDDDDDELRQLLRDTPRPVCLDGFEPSDRMTIAQGVGKAIQVKQMLSAGCKVKIVVADLCALLNKKMGGDRSAIRAAGQRMVETWKALGVDDDGVEFLWSSEEIGRRAAEYWLLVLGVAQKVDYETTVSCCKAVRRNAKDELSAAQFMCPIMQCADVLFFEADICHMGMDQEKVNEQARKYCAAIGRKNQPIVLSYDTLPGLKDGKKVTKVDESSAIFMEDDEVKVNQKIKKTFCPPKITEGNPCLEYIKKIVLPWLGRFDVFRKQANGGDKTYNEMEEIFQDYVSGALHPADVKSNLAKAINLMLQPVRDHLDRNSDTKVLLHTVKSDPPSSNSDFPSCIPPKIAEKKYESLLSIGEECIEKEELQRLLQEKTHPICYDGFEPSGRMHIAQGVGKAISVNKMVGAECRVKIWIADWFALLNKKMAGDLNKIQTVGRYMIEIWKALGMNMKGVEFLWASEEINKRVDEYWAIVVDIAQRRTLNRIVRCSQIMGRSEKDNLTAAQVFYPLMQCADILFLEFEVLRVETNGGNRTYNRIEDLHMDYSSGALHPADVKPALAKAINQILQPVRDHFNNNSEAKALLGTVKSAVFVDLPADPGAPISGQPDDQKLRLASVPQRRQLQLPSKSCLLRWFNQLDPRISKRPFSDEEEERLTAHHRFYGNGTAAGASSALIWTLDERMTIPAGTNAAAVSGGRRRRRDRKMDGDAMELLGQLPFQPNFATEGEVAIRKNDLEPRGDEVAPPLPAAVRSPSPAASSLSPAKIPPPCVVRFRATDLSLSPRREEDSSRERQDWLYSPLSLAMAMAAQPAPLLVD
ncbi:hypothetical protein PR202_gb13620 [Eleusine coracana subsp. coracana]|uniref:tyrosine--tRNA ligase n=1 Tax=Eleusine coracana subsp. coracana TaxID=191504 RepID=A0AAV5ET26_ELECO|nr:hypothetical protein PR202_gb13620 [Eleusine coracana subsp. coracana]